MPDVMDQDAVIPEDVTPEVDPIEPPAPEPGGKKRRGRKQKGGADGAPPPGYVPGEEQTGIKEFFRILRERRALRKDLKAKGIKKRSDFEAIAESLGLVLWKLSPLLLWLHHLWGAIKAGVGLKSLLAAAAALLAGLFLASVITEEAGSFTINLTADMLRAGFVLSSDISFKQEETRLFSEHTEDINNITFSDISTNVDDIDGPHNGSNYIAYTFYVKNKGEETADYAWYLNLVSEIKGVSKAAWIMLYEDGKQLIYAQANEDGRPEELYGFRRLVFDRDCYDWESQYYEENGLYGIITTPYANEETVAQGLLQGVVPGEVHKYTVVIWLEGHDPDCTDEIFGGYAKYEMNFENVTDISTGSIFNGVYRTEYQDYGKYTPPEAEASTP